MRITIKMPDESSLETLFPIQLPHKILEYLVSQCHLSCADLQVEKYWKHLESVGDDFALSTREFRRLARSPVWPLGIHGDEAAIGLINAPTNKINGIFLNLVLFRPKATRLSRYLLFAIESEKMWSMIDTIYPVLEALTESLNLCAEKGVGGRRFLLSEIRGDQVWFRQIFRHKAYWLGNHICFRCKATAQATNMSYAVYNSDGSWTSTRRSTNEFLEEELSQPICFSENVIGYFFRFDLDLILFFLFPRSLVGKFPVDMRGVSGIIRSLGEHPLLQCQSTSALYPAHLESGSLGRGEWGGLVTWIHAYKQRFGG